MRGILQWAEQELSKGLTILRTGNEALQGVREMFPYATESSVGKVRVVGSPIKFPEEPTVALSCAPALGQHTKETLADWFGMDSTELSSLQTEGVILQA